MSKPESVKIDPWTDFPRLPYSIINDDFVHDKLYTFKVNAKGEKSTFNVKANLKSDKSGLKVADQVKFWFALPGNRSFYSKIKSTDAIKMHFDNGFVERWNKKWNLYATLNSSKSLQNVSLRLGAAHKSEHCSSDNRLRVDFHDERRQSYTWYHRTMVNHEKFTFGLLGVYGITHNVMAKTSLLLGYEIKPDRNVYLRVENDKFRSNHWGFNEIADHLDLFRVDYVARYNESTRYGVEAIVRKATKYNLDEALVVIEHKNKEKKWTAKARLSSKVNLSLSFNYPSFLMPDNAKVTVGLHGSNLHTNDRTFSGGVQFECNV